MKSTRRQILAAGLAAAGSAALPMPAFSAARHLTLGRRSIEVAGKAATVYGITGISGESGLVLSPGERFALTVESALDEESVIHWHGLRAPFDQDGSHVSQALIPARGSMSYDFPLNQSGTNWMHSHHGLQEQGMLAAPLILRSPDDVAADRQEVVVMLHDFSFTPAEEILAGLTLGHGNAHGTEGATMNMGQMSGMDHSQMDMSDGAGMMMEMDLNDVVFDAYLANDRDLSDPEVVSVEPGGRVLMRIINGASATNFWVDLGAEAGRLISVDGMPVEPIVASRFELAMAQRVDIELTVRQGSLPVLFQREGDLVRTGIVLATKRAPVEKISPQADQVAPPVATGLETRLRALAPLAPRPADLTIHLPLTGSMAPYNWSVGHGALPRLQKGQRVEMMFMNQSMMSHPMHLHGHHFQVLSAGGKQFSGALRDTILVPAMDMVTIAFDADNPGRWPLHCHNLYHMASGMMSVLEYA